MPLGATPVGAFPPATSWLQEGTRKNLGFAIAEWCYGAVCPERAPFSDIDIARVSGKGNRFRTAVRKWRPLAGRELVGSHVNPSERRLLLLSSC